MTQRDNILQELKELESTLADLSLQNIYSTPAGYFEGLADQVLNRIKAMESGNAADELSYLSPALSAVTKEMPYTIPSGYFAGVAEKMMRVVSQSNNQTAKEELENLSPLLNSLKKEMPYTVPAGYFDSIQTKPVTRAKVVSITSRKWFRYAAAAVLIGIIATTALLIINHSQKSLDRIEAKVEKEIKKASDKELIEFVELTDASKDLAYNETKEEVKELLKDVSAAELQEFLDEIADPVSSSTETSSME